jgi:threonine synthase
VREYLIKVNNLWSARGSLVPNNLLGCPSCRNTYPAQSGVFSCPERRPGEEHTLHRILDSNAQPAENIRNSWKDGSPRTFERLRPLLSGCSLIGDARYRRILDAMTDRLLRLESRDFDITPLTEEPDLRASLGRTGRLWVKNETGNVTGSHKGRHLMATLLYLDALRELKGETAKKVLAIYSCGNAALGAAAVARAGGYELHAFVPEDVDRTVAAMLAERGALVEKIPRAGTGEGDPCYLAFQEALRQNGWLPFACAGNDNWSNIEGGATLGWEMVMQLGDRSERIDSIVIQVGGGALARSVAQAFEEALQLGFIKALPRIHVCQPEGGFPFVRAFLLVLAEIARRCGQAFDLAYDRSADSKAQLQLMSAFARSCPDQIGDAAAYAKRDFATAPVQAVLNDMVRRPDRFMWPWDGAAPHSLAHGILDDITYDWYFLLRAVLRSGGRAEILSEGTISDAYEKAHFHTGIPVCPTGASGLAGLIQLQASGAVAPGESVGLFFTGFDRARAK